jgi:hypothetical protein
MSVLSNVFNTYKYAEDSLAVTASTANTNLDLSLSSTFVVTLGSNTTFSLTNFTAITNKLSNFNVILVNDATAGRTITWPASVKWAGGLVPPKTTTANAVDIWSFFTYNGGTTWVGSLAMKDVK